jgi:hypothetical protein
MTYRGKHAARAPLRVRLPLTVLAAASLVLALAVQPALAATDRSNGSKGYVTQSNELCDVEFSLEDNSITGTIAVNLKIPGDEATDLVFTIYDNGTAKDDANIVYGPTTIEPEDCDTPGNLWFVILTTLEPGQYTLVVTYPDGTNFSADSFRVLAD